MLTDGKTPANVSQTAARSSLPKSSGDGNVAPRPLLLRDLPASLVGLAVFLGVIL